MAIMWMGYHLIAADNKRISPAGKHNLILLFVFIGSEWFVYSFIHLLKEPNDRLLPGVFRLSASANVWLSGLSILYLIVLLTRLFQHLLQYFRVRNNKCNHSASPHLQSFADR